LEGTAKLGQSTRAVKNQAFSGAAKEGRQQRVARFRFEIYKKKMTVKMMLTPLNPP
jgi:hypothetical protein